MLPGKRCGQRGAGQVPRAVRCRKKMPTAARPVSVSQPSSGDPGRGVGDGGEGRPARNRGGRASRRGRAGWSSVARSGVQPGAVLAVLTKWSWPRADQAGRRVRRPARAGTPADPGGGREGGPAAGRRHRLSGDRGEGPRSRLGAYPGDERSGVRPGPALGGQDEGAVGGDVRRGPQRPAAAGRGKQEQLQNRFGPVAPIGIAAQVPAGEVREVAAESCVVAGRWAAGVRLGVLAHPAARAATARAATARAAATRDDLVMTRAGPGSPRRPVRRRMTTWWRRYRGRGPCPVPRAGGRRRR